MNGPLFPSWATGGPEKVAGQNLQLPEEVIRQGHPFTDLTMNWPSGTVVPPQDKTPEAKRNIIREGRMAASRDFRL